MSCWTLICLFTMVLFISEVTVTQHPTTNPTLEPIFSTNPTIQPTIEPTTQPSQIILMNNISRRSCDVDYNYHFYPMRQQMNLPLKLFDDEYIIGIGGV
eukprot:414329_1